MFSALFFLLAQLLGFYTFVVIAYVASSWLVALNVVNPRNKNVAFVLMWVNKLVEPVLNPIRKVIPVLGGIDISPIVLIFGIMFVQKILLSL